LKQFSPRFCYENVVAVLVLTITVKIFEVSIGLMTIRDKFRNLFFCLQILAVSFRQCLIEFSASNCSSDIKFVTNQRTSIRKVNGKHRFEIRKSGISQLVLCLQNPPESRRLLVCLQSANLNRRCKSSIFSRVAWSRAMSEEHQ